MNGKSTLWTEYDLGEYNFLRTHICLVLTKNQHNYFCWYSHDHPTKKKIIPSVAHRKIYDWRVGGFREKLKVQNVNKNLRETVRMKKTLNLQSF